jgi:molecular chaperone HtpG
VLGDKVKEVRVSHRLTQSPACLVVEEHDMGSSLRNLLKAAGHDIPTVVPVIEVNPRHPLVARLNDEQDAQRFEDWVTILFDQALLAEGGQLEDPAGFVRRLNDLLLLLSH